MGRGGWREREDDGRQRGTQEEAEREQKICMQGDYIEIEV